MRFGSVLNNGYFTIGMDDSLFAQFDWAAAGIGPVVIEYGGGPITFARNPVGNTGDLAVLGPTARSTYGVTGAGIKIGILSDSFNLKGKMASNIAVGALPADVTIVKEGPAGSSDEGRAMAELVHKIAPGASIYFYSAFYSELDFAAGITALGALGCNIIVDDVAYFDEPFFQIGSAIDKAIDQVTASGVSYFTAVGNDGQDYYQGTFTGITSALPGITGTYKAENFGTAAVPNPLQSITIPTGDNVIFDLQWDQPYQNIGIGHASANSLAMVLYDNTNKIVASGRIRDVGKNPVQLMSFTNNSATNTAYRLAIYTNGGAVAPGTFKYLMMSGGSTINDANAGIGSGSAYGHAIDPAANSVGAIAAASAPANGGNGQVEYFSSSGPGLILFDGTGTKLTTPLVPNKPNFVAPDGVQTDVFKPFYGTSAAAPDAAAVAALMLQAQPGLLPAQVTSILAASAIPVTGAANTTGAGLVQATTAVQLALATTPGAVSAVALAGYTAPSPSFLAPNGSNATVGIAATADFAGASYSASPLLAVLASYPTAQGFWAEIDLAATNYADAAAAGGASAMATLAHLTDVIVLGHP